MQPYIIRKCSHCKSWHLFKKLEVGDYFTFVVIYSFESWWDEGLMIINFPQLIMSGE